MTIKEEYGEAGNPVLIVDENLAICGSELNHEEVAISSIVHHLTAPDGRIEVAKALAEYVKQKKFERKVDENLQFLLDSWCSG